MRLLVIFVAAALLSRDPCTASAQTRPDSLAIADAIAHRALMDARRQIPATMQLVIQPASQSRCPQCVNYLFEALDNVVLSIKDSVPLCPWHGGRPDAGFALSISDLRMLERRATVHVGLACAGDSDTNRGFVWLLEYKLQETGGRWIITGVADILIT